MLPSFLKSNFWFVEFNKLDLKRDKRFIVFQILNHGGSLDWEWLFKEYPHDEIRQIVGESLATAWFKKSLGLWEAVLGVKAKSSRFPDLPLMPSIWSY